MARRPLQERFWEKVDRRGDDECWPWIGRLNYKGYGIFDLVADDGKVKHPRAHRLAYEWLVGPIPEGLYTDHLCRVRHCVNPAHLEPVTPRENVMRGDTVASRAAAATHCPQGHAYKGDNIAWHKRPNGRFDRDCRICVRDRARRYQAKKRVDLKVAA